MYTVDLSDEIYSELGEPDSLSIAAIAFWLKTNYAKLNNVIFTDYTLNSAGDIVDGDGNTIGVNEANILKKMYAIYKIEQDIRTNTNSIEAAGVVEISKKGATVRKINKNEVVKSLTSLRSQESEELKNLISLYKIGKARPQNVNLRDTKLLIDDCS